MLVNQQTQINLSMNQYKINTLAIYKRTFIVEAEDEYLAAVEVFNAMKAGKMKDGSSLPEEVLDQEVPPKLWPVWKHKDNTQPTSVEETGSIVQAAYNNQVTFTSKKDY